MHELRYIKDRDEMRKMRCNKWWWWWCDDDDDDIRPII